MSDAQPAGEVRPLSLALKGLFPVALLAVFLARLVTAQFMGDWLLRRIGQQQPSEYLALAGGLVLFFLLTEIPYVGFLIWLTALFLGVGGLFLAARGQRPAATMNG